MCNSLHSGSPHGGDLLWQRFVLAVVVFFSFMPLLSSQEEDKQDEEDRQQEIDDAIDQLQDSSQVHLLDSKSRLSDVAIPLQISSMPKTNRPIIGLGDPFLGSGAISEGFDIGTGAIWNPSFYVFGTFRSAIQGYDNGQEFITEWANRLDLFGNLQLTQTERILIGFRPIDFRGQQFSGYAIGPDSIDGWEQGFNGRITTLFFEGDFGEIFPNLDSDDSGILDFGFALGRQPLVIQNGILIDDTVDGFGLVRNTLLPAGFANLRLTFFYAWNNIHRANRAADGGAELYALFTEADFGESFIDVDLVYVSAPADSGDAFYFAVSATQRLGHFNSTFRFLGSIPLEGDTPFTQGGFLLLAEISWTPTGTDDLYYINGFLGIDEYSSAARAPDVGGPLARTGILYTAQGLGRFGSALDSEPAESVGLSAGRQFFWDEFRSQIIVEVGGRIDTDGSNRGAAAIGLRYQRALGENLILQTDFHAALQERREPGYGIRMELTIKF